jgi:hypothetical protein
LRLVERDRQAASSSRISRSFGLTGAVVVARDAGARREERDRTSVRPALADPPYEDCRHDGSPTSPAVGAHHALVVVGISERVELELSRPRHDRRYGSARITVFSR